MRNKMDKLISLMVFCVLYYVYMNSVRKVFIPYSSVVIPTIVLLLAIVTIISSKGKIYFSGTYDKLICISWLLIMIYIFVNNSSLEYNIIKGGMVQLYVMILFLVFINNKSSWINVWIETTIIFVLISAIATVVFYFNSNLYYQFVDIMFSGDIAIDCIRNYNKGYMSGLCDHFSSNGMILAIGIMFVWEKINYKIKLNQKNNFISYILLLLMLYALILSSKRSPLLAAGCSIVITYIIASGKNKAKSFVTLGVLGIIAGIGYTILLPNIPGLSTIADKTTNLGNSSAGILNGRLSLWNIALEMFENKPVLGNGYGSYAIWAKKVDAISTSAHNYYLHVLSELGCLGLILYLVAFSFAGINTIKNLNSAIKKKEEKDIFILRISLDVQIFVVIYNLTATALMYYYILIPYFLAITVSRVIEIKNKLNEEN